ncbi:MAG: ABC transporter permease [Alphaproteobacteria bacterium]
MNIDNTSLLKSIFKAREFGLIIIIAVIFIAMTFSSEYFLTPDNLLSMIKSFSVEAIIVIGMTILLISGGIDLSVGSVTALAMVIAGSLFLNGFDPWISSLIAIAVCSLIGVLMGTMVTTVGLHHFIVSLGAMVIARGLCMLGTGGRPLGLFALPAEFKWIGTGSIGPIPVVIVIFIIFVVAFDFLLRRTTAFRKVVYTGSNQKAAAYSGVRTKRVIFLTTVLTSTLSGIAGIIYMARFGSAQPTFGIGMELNVIAAAVIGGASLSGGSGTIYGAILGSLLLAVVSSSLTLLNVSVYWQDIIRGSILLFAVTFDHYLVRKK